MSLQELTFSQSGLQDFEDCPRRFQLRYLDRRVWPAIQAEPVVEHERHLDRGVRFHRLIERHQLGLSESVLSPSIDDLQLMEWWRSYLNYAASHIGEGERHPEYILWANVEDVRFVAKYDLLLVQPDQRVVIFDWKTYPRSPGHDWFSKRAQTRVYPVVLLASGRFPWLQSSMVRLVYWIAGSTLPVEFSYGEQQFQADKQYLGDCLDRMKRLEGVLEWPLVADERACRFCVYRSLCGRGVGAWPIDDDQSMELFDFGVGGGWDSVVGLDWVDGVGF